MTKQKLKLKKSDKISSSSGSSDLRGKDGGGVGDDGSHGSISPQSKSYGKVSFVAEVQSMMYALGDCRKPFLESAVLVEQIVRQQATSLLREAAEVCVMRGARFIGIEDFIYLMKGNHERLHQLFQFLLFKDAKVLRLVSDDGDAAAIAGIDQKGNKRRKVCQEFLNVIDHTGELLAILENEDIDSHRLQRQERQEQQTRTMDLATYQEFSEARRVHFCSLHEDTHLKPLSHQGCSHAALELQPLNHGSAKVSTVRSSRAYRCGSGNLLGLQRNTIVDLGRLTTATALYIHNVAAKAQCSDQLSVRTHYVAAAAHIKKMSKFKEWVDAHNLDPKPSSFALEILSHLAYETVAQIVELSLFVRRDMLASPTDPITQTMAPVSINDLSSQGVLPTHPKLASSPTSTPLQSPVATSPKSPHEKMVSPFLSASGGNSSMNVSGNSNASDNSNPGDIKPGTPSGGGSSKSKSKKKKKPSSSSLHNLIQHRGIQPCHIKEAMRRYQERSGPMAAFSKASIEGGRFRYLAC
ncbi:Transcription initiation protein SPT3-like [Holothuria leucospilota]|uniref:Transcription initiation protein SPT3-like n=1 Tax=Holothuria leucospilota TaxID=206669 RepID=A0A9Q1H0A7_HOLLE|nr:Transcription initiation protein SPT3-like [Holothuria leucospilota]